MGKARDVVKISLRSNSSLNSSCIPDVIYSILTQYFSNTSSYLPQQDVYSTLPNQRENLTDYWISLNKAADVADEGLKHQGRYMENMGGEIAKMCVKHCPDLESASVFKYKQIHE